jgi:hypothetical protein
MRNQRGVVLPALICMRYRAICGCSCLLIEACLLWCSAVGTATKLRAGRHRDWSSSPDGGNFFTPPPSARAVLVPFEPPTLSVPVAQLVQRPRKRGSVIHAPIRLHREVLNFLNTDSYTLKISRVQFLSLQCQHEGLQPVTE